MLLSNGLISNNRIFGGQTQGIGGIDAYTVMMLHLNGSASSTYIQDSCASPNIVTANGNAAISLTQSKFGGSSLYLDGTTDYLTTPDSAAWNFGTDYMCIDFWVYAGNVTGDNFLFFQAGTGTAYHGIEIYNGGISWQYNNGSSYLLNVASAGSLISINTWTHILCCRYKTSVYVAIGGIFRTLTGTQIAANALPDFSNSLYIGASNTGSQAYTGYLNEYRISKGAYRQIGDFTPPTEQYSV